MGNRNNNGMPGMVLKLTGRMGPTGADGLRQLPR